MCLKAIKEQPIRVNMEYRFSTIYVSDAVDTPLLVQEIHDWNAREVLSNKRFEEEFGLRVFINQKK